jgi:hypothetical protein
MAQNYKIASEWESDTITVADKTSLKEFVMGLVGYPCKIACKRAEETLDIYVFSEKKKKVTDWIEIQSSGAVGVIYDFYNEGVNTDKLDDACEAYNKANGLTFEEDSESESDEEDEDDDDDEEVEVPNENKKAK